MQNIKLANAISSLLDDCNVSETEICRQTNLPRATIYRLKEGLVDPRLSTLKTFADFFKISIDQLIGEKEINNKTPCKSFNIPIMQWSIATLMQIEKNSSKDNFLIFQTDDSSDEDNYIALQTFSDAMSP
ncbi:MAG: helix-turn-helix transcriptional regulator [Gammaproteobacteria bacterium]|nr:helix-turn-helix transcriptional regulator [Gammaproteobacteria bacterium]